MHYTVVEKKTLPKSGYFLHVEIPAEEIVGEESRVLADMKRDAELPGFRKGFVPDNILRKRMGELALWEEAATHALSHVLAEIFKVEKLDVVGRPHVEAQKLAPGNPAEFKVTLALYPELTLPDYRKIAAAANVKKPESTDIEEKEIDTVVAEIKKQHEAATDKKDFEITDDTVKEFGAFKTVGDFRAKVKEGLVSHKEERGREKRRAELLDALTEKTKGDIPEVMIEGELERMEAELRTQIERMGGKWDDYLKEIKKDGPTLRKDWRKDAERRARLQLMLFQIARAENLVAPADQIETEVKHLLEHYKGAHAENARSYVETLLTNQKVLAFLEDQK